MFWKEESLLLFNFFNAHLIAISSHQFNMFVRNTPMYGNAHLHCLNFESRTLSTPSTPSSILSKIHCSFLYYRCNLVMRISGKYLTCWGLCVCTGPPSVERECWSKHVCGRRLDYPWPVSATTIGGNWAASHTMKLATCASNVGLILSYHIP